MAKRKDEREEEQDQGTKAEHGIGREDAAMENRGTKAELGGGNNTDWLEDPKAELGGGNDSDWIKDPKAESADVDIGPIRPTGPAESAGLDVGPVAREGGDKDDTVSAIPLPSPMPAPDEADPLVVEGSSTVAPAHELITKDPQASFADTDVEGADIVDPIHAEGDDFDDHDEDADWDDGPEMEAEAEVDVDIDDDEEEEMER